MLIIWSFISVPILQMRKLSFPKAWSQSHLHQDPLGYLLKIQIPRLCPLPHSLAQQVWVGPGTCIFMAVAKWFSCTLKLEEHRGLE